MNATDTLAQRLFITMGRIASRSDVKILERKVNTSGYPFKRKVWEKFLPEDMLAFYEAVNGLIYAWTFTDTDDFHGPFMAALSDGKKTINLRSGRYALPFIKVGSFGPLQTDSGTPIDKKLSLLMFDGTDDAAGAVMLFDGESPQGVYAYDNDGYLTRIADDFGGAMELGLAVGFCHMYRSPSHPIPQEVARRLAEPVAPKKTGILEVTHIEECDTNGWRRALGMYLHPWFHANKLFDNAMEVMKRKERYDALTAEQRGDLFVELFSDPTSLSDAQAKKMSLVSVYTPNKAKKDLTAEDFAKVFRCENEPLTRVEYSVDWDVPGKYPRCEANEDLRAFMNVEAFGSVRAGCPFDPDIVHYCPPFLYPTEWNAIVGQFTLEQITSIRARRVAFFRRKDAQDIRLGTYDVSALPVVSYDL